MERWTPRVSRARPGLREAHPVMRGPGEEARARLVYALGKLKVGLWLLHLLRSQPLAHSLSLMGFDHLKYDRFVFLNHPSDIDVH